MMRMVIIFFLFFSSVYSLEIGVNSFLQEIENDPTNIDARLVIARYHIKNGESEKAEDYLEQVLKIEKDNKKAKSMLSSLNRSQLDKKESLFTRVDNLEKIYKESNSFDDFKEYYYELEGLGYKERGFERLESFVDNHKKDEEAVLFLANRYYWDGKLKKSLKVLKPLVRSKNKKIKSLYKKINKKKSNSNSKYRQKAEKLYLKAEFLKAITYYKKYFKKARKDSKARFHYAAALENLEKFKRSEKQYYQVLQNVDNLYELSSYRYARVLMSQRDSFKWDEARRVLENLQQVLLDTPASEKTDELLKYVRQSLEVLYKPLPKPSKHKDVMLTSEQRKILDQPTLTGNAIVVQEVLSVKSMLNPVLASVNDNMDVKGTIFSSMINEQSLQNREYGVKITVSSISVEAKKSTFKNGKKLQAQSLSATYNNSDNFSINAGINSFDDATKYSAKINYQQVYDKHDITYSAGYQNGIFKNSSPCMIDNDIDVISLSVYDSYLLENLKHTELTLELNSFSDGNLNLNSWINYPLYNHIKGDFENIFSLSGSYEFNSKDDTCYGATEFFDASYLQMKSKYSFKNGYLEARGSIGYSVENSDTVYSYGFMLGFYTVNSMNIYINCNHYQSGYSPDGADECYVSLSHVW